MKTDLTTTVYTPQSPLRHPVQLMRGLARDLFRYRQLVWMLFTRDLRAGHRQSLLGYLWLVLPPFSISAIWVILRSQKIIQIETGIPYILFVLTGMMTWTSFVAFLTAPQAGLKAGRSVIMKLNVPAEAFIMSSLLRVSFESLIRFLTLIPVYLMVGYVPTANLLLLPVALVSCFSVACAIGLILTPGGELYDDIGKGINMITRVLMYSVPVIFPLGREGWLNDVLEANPLTPGFMFVRGMLTDGSMEWARSAMAIGGAALVVCVVSVLLFRVSRPHLVERMGM
jgi:lipopolysaccharide transport system permease protein